MTDTLNNAAPSPRPIPRRPTSGSSRSTRWWPPGAGTGRPTSCGRCRRGPEQPGVATPAKLVTDYVNTIPTVGGA